MAHFQEHIGRYQILEELGRGAMGMVFLARDPVIDRTVALKTIDISAAAETKNHFRDRLLLEAKAAGRLNHPNIVSVFDAGEEHDLAYIVMEYIQGRTLKEVIAASCPLATRRLIDIAMQLADALGYANKLGVVHRDIKPENILLTDDGHVRLADFGIARMIDSSSGTVTGKIHGSPRYMSPEQLKGGDVDHRSDIFSLGAVIYEMATGYPAFGRPGSDVAAVAEEIVSVDPRPPKSINPLVPDALDLLIRRSLAKDPNVRYQDAILLLRDLRELSKITMVDYELTKTLTLDTFKLANVGHDEGHPLLRSSSSEIWQPGQKLKTYISTVLFADIVGYSLHQIPKQAELKRLFVQAVSLAMQNIPDDERMILDTGDGAAFSFHGNPCHALDTALKLRELSEEKGVTLRVGINTGPVQLVTGVNKQFDLVGDGINDAQRVMGFAKPRQIIVSRTFHDVALRIMEFKKSKFVYSGAKLDKHGRQHELYEFKHENKSQEHPTSDVEQVKADPDWENFQTRLISDLQSFEFSEQQLLSEIAADKQHSRSAVLKLDYPAITPLPVHPSEKGKASQAGSENNSDFLAQLTQEAMRIRGIEREKGARAIQEADKTTAKLNGTMQDIFNFWNEFLAQLNVIKPKNPRIYSLMRLGKIDRLKWKQGYADYRTCVINNSSVFERIAVTITQAGPAHHVAEREVSAAAELRRQLSELNIPFIEEEIRNQLGRVDRIRFKIPFEVRISLLFACDYERKVIRFYSRNIERFGKAEMSFLVDEITKETLEEIAKLILGIPSRIIMMG